MSEPSLPSPAPPLPASGTAPIPVQPLTYSAPSYGRPGIITGIGISSIIVGSLAILFGALGLLNAVSFAFAASAIAATPVATSGAAPAATGVSGETVADDSEDGPEMPRVRREVVIGALTSLHSMDARRRARLDELLAEHGEEIFRFGNDAEPLSEQRVRASVSDHGQTDAEDPGDYFIVGLGKIEVENDAAAFIPAAVGEETVRIQGDGPQSAAIDDETDAKRLSDGHIKAIVDHVQTMLTPGKGMSTAQVKALTQLLNAPDADYVTPGSGVRWAESQVSMATAMPNGDVMIYFTNGYVQLSQSGTVTNSALWSATATGTTARTAAWRFVRGPAIVAAIASLANIGLAILLLIAGILALRQSQLARTLHWYYAWIKLPLAIVSGIAWVMMWQAMMNSAMTFGGGSATAMWSTASIISAVMLVGAGALYPIIVMILHSTPMVRAYYAGHKSQAG